MARTIFRGSRKARTQKCARAHSNAERSTADPEIPARNSVRNSKRRTFGSWLRFGEAYSALRDWRPIPAALLSHSVVQCSGTEEFLPTTTAIHLRSPPSGKKLPRQTTNYKEENVQCQIIFETSMWKIRAKLALWPRPCL